MALNETKWRRRTSEVTADGGSAKTLKHKILDSFALDNDGPSPPSHPPRVTRQTLSIHCQPHRLSPAGQELSDGLDFPDSTSCPAWVRMGFTSRRISLQETLNDRD